MSGNIFLTVDPERNNLLFLSILPSPTPLTWNIQRSVLNPIKITASCGVRTHAIFRLSELKSDALDHSANLAVTEHDEISC